VSRSSTWAARILVADGLGSTLALLDPLGAVTAQYSYGAFGGTSATGEQNTNLTQYTGRELDETGLYYYRGRYYSPALLRFISEDPIGFAGGDSNLYAYVFDAPTNFVDPMGLDPWTRLSGGLRAIGGGFEAGAGVGLAIATGWTGIGAVAGGAVGLHGLDQLQAGLRQVFGSCRVDSFTSEGLRRAGLSRSAANTIDTGISIAGSLGAGTATQAIRAGGLENVGLYEVGQKTLSANDYARYGNIADPVERGGQIVADRGWPSALLRPEGLSQYPKTVPQGLTPLARGGAGALGALAGRK
jgi:RHS repeat-associated protein